MMRHAIALLMVAGVWAAASCRSPRPAAPAAPPLKLVEAPDGTTGASRIIGAPPPRAVAYRTDGNFADNVPVQVSPEGVLLSYPAPSDVRGAAPLPLADGYLLDRRGVGPNTVFTRYTYAAYGALPEAPQPEEILSSVIPGSRVTSAVELPMTMEEAVADTAAVNAYIRSLQH